VPRQNPTAISSAEPAQPSNVTVSTDTHSSRRQ
jgi:hypothetical protein